MWRACLGFNAEKEKRGWKRERFERSLHTGEPQPKQAIYQVARRSKQSSDRARTRAANE